MKPQFNINLYHKRFRNFVVKSFAFLVKKFNFKIVKEGKEPYIFSYRITYKNKTTAIEISYDMRDEGISVFIHRLVDGQIPDHLVFVSKNSVINGYYIDDIITIRSSNPDEEFYTIRHVRKFPPIYNDKTMKKIVNEYATALKKYATDIMNGDFSIFPKLEKKLKKYAENKNVITYNLPYKEYGKGKEKKIIKDHRKNFGKEVRYIIKYYKIK